ncbi:MAG: CatA-like O-acetyltransferase [Elusimicrobiaceae bacterium]|nr:CatA-like O-acetyltransferase [Elusimicrobiaceae bacterium]
MKELDIDSWHRKDIYTTFRRFQFPHFAVSADINVSELAAFSKRHKLSFYRLMLYIVCRAGNGIQAFRLRLRPGGVIEHEVVGIAPAFGTKPEGRYNFCTAPYHENPAEFIRVYNEKEDRSRGLDHLYLEDDHKDDSLYVSCLPWLRLTSLINPVAAAEDSIPRITWGKYSGSGSDVTMMVSLQMHHALADGYDAALFYAGLQKLADSPRDVFAALL